MEPCRTRKRIVVLVPLPFQGHVTPMLQLGSILHSKGFSIVVAHSQYRAPNPLNHPEFTFQPLLDNLSASDDSFPNLLDLIFAIHNNCRPLLEEFMVKLMEDQKLHDYQVACIVYDGHMYFVDSIAKHLNIPSIVLRSYAATYLKSYQCIFQLQAQNCIPFPESNVLDFVPELHPIPVRFKDLPHSVTSEIPEKLMSFFVASNNIHSSTAIVFNTTDYLEHSTLSALQQQFRVPLFPIGPFHKMAAARSTSFLEEDRSCIAWLDKQASNSVLYVSLGSLASMDEQELTETAWGLANSGQPFLWVIRPGSVIGSPWDEHFPEGFKALVGEMGIVVKWAPQKEVLAHRAVGGFWSHCGWNSTMESICEGVPMICRPHFGDQKMNTRFLTCLWKVGLEMENVLDRGIIERTIRKLMVGIEGKEMRQRMFDMKEKLEAGLKKGGSSYESLNDLTEFIASFSAGK